MHCLQSWAVHGPHGRHPRPACPSQLGGRDRGVKYFCRGRGRIPNLPGISVSFPLNPSCSIPGKIYTCLQLPFLERIGTSTRVRRDSTRGNVDVTHAMCVTMCSLVGVDLLASQWQCTRRSCAASNRPLGRTTCMRTCSPPSQWPAQCCSLQSTKSVTGNNNLNKAAIRDRTQAGPLDSFSLSHSVTVRLSCILALSNWSAA